MHLKRGPRAHAGNIHVLRDGAVLLRAETDKPEPRLAPSGRSSKAALRQGRLNTRAGRKLRVSGPAGGSECAGGVRGQLRGARVSWALRVTATRVTIIHVTTTCGRRHLGGCARKRCRGRRLQPVLHRKCVCALSLAQLLTRTHNRLMRLLRLLLLRRLLRLRLLLWLLRLLIVSLLLRLRLLIVSLLLLLRLLLLLLWLLIVSLLLLRRRRQLLLRLRLRLLIVSLRRLLLLLQRLLLLQLLLLPRRQLRLRLLLLRRLRLEVGLLLLLLQRRLLLRLLRWRLLLLLCVCGARRSFLGSTHQFLRLREHGA